MSTFQRDDTSLKSVLLRLSDHLDSLSTKVLIVEEALGDTLGKFDQQTAIDLKKVQQLDYVRQSIEDCALLSLLLAQMDFEVLDVIFDERQIATRLKLESTVSILKSTQSLNRSVDDGVQLF